MEGFGFERLQISPGRVLPERYPVLTSSRITGQSQIFGFVGEEQHCDFRCDTLPIEYGLAKNFDVPHRCGFSY